MIRNIRILSDDRIQERCGKIYKKISFRHGIKHVPDEDIAYLRKFIPNEEIPYGDFQLKMMIAQNRHMNKICDYCWNKQNTSKLFVCSGCYLTFYCNKECQQKHWHKHKLRCGKKDGPLDDGPQRITIFEREDKNNVTNNNYIIHI